MPIPSPADFRNKTKKHSEVREMLAQLVENVASLDFANSNPLFKPVVIAPTESRDLNTMDQTGIYYFSTIGAANLAQNKPENTPFVLHVDRVHSNALTVTQTIITKTGNYYYRVGVRASISDPLVFPAFKIILDSENFDAKATEKGYVKPKDISGVIDNVGILTPEVCETLGYINVDMIPTGTYYVTSSTLAASLDLPNSRVGLLTVSKGGTITVTGFRTYAPLGKEGIYTSRYYETWSPWSYIASQSEIETYMAAQGFTKQVNESGVIDNVGILTPGIVTSLGYTSWQDINVNGTYAITSRQTSIDWNLPESRGGRLTIDKAGTTATATGRATWQPNSSKGLYVATTIATGWSDWNYLPSLTEIETLLAGTTAIDKSVDNSVIGIGSSSMHRFAAQMIVEMAEKKRTYINAGYGGTTIATAAMFCGQANYYMNFASDTVLQNDVQTSFSWSNDGFGIITGNPGGDDRGWKCTLENGVRGTIYFTTKRFKPENLSENITVSGAVKVMPDYARYKRAINLVSTGKNSISPGGATQIAFVKESFDETIRQLLDAQPDGRYIVIGHHVNRGSNETVKSAIAEINSYLKNKYGNRYLDTQNWMMGEEIWTQLGITPTQADLDMQAAGEIAPSISSDAIHMNQSVANYFVTNFIVPKLVAIGYV